MKTIDTALLTNTKINEIIINTGMPCNKNNQNSEDKRTVTYVVMHYTGNAEDSALANAKYFNGDNRRASAHFFVDDLNIYQSVPLKNIAWHCGGKSYVHKTCRNKNAIGIEMCCTAGNYRISDKTKENAAYLCAYICKLIGIKSSEVDKYVLRHYDVTGKRCPAQMVDNEKEWTEFKAQVEKLIG